MMRANPRTTLASIASISLLMTLWLPPRGNPLSAQEPAAPMVRVTLTRELGEQKNSIFGIAISPDGGLLACVGAEKKIVLYETESWGVVATSTEPQGIMLGVAFSPDGKWLFAWGDPQQVLVLSVPTLALKERIRLSFRPERLAVSPTAPNILVGAAKTPPQIWEVFPAVKQIGELRSNHLAGNPRPGLLS